MVGYILSRLHKNISLSSINVHHAKISGYLLTFFLGKEVAISGLELGFILRFFRDKAHGFEVIPPGFCIVDLAVTFCCCNSAVP